METSARGVQRGLLHPSSRETTGFVSIITKDRNKCRHFSQKKTRHSQIRASFTRARIYGLSSLHAGIGDVCCYPGFDDCHTSDARYDYAEKRWCHKDQYDANGGTCKNASGGYDFWIYGTVYDWCRCDGYSNYFNCHVDSDWGAPAYGSGMKQECIPMTDNGKPIWEGGQPVDWKVDGGGWDPNGNPDFPITTGGGAAWALDAQCSSQGGAGKDVCAGAGYINSAVKRGIVGNCAAMGGRKNSDDGTWCIPDGDWCEDIGFWQK